MADSLLDRLRAVEASSFCDADKTLRLVDPAIRALVPGAAVVGPAFTVVAPDDHLPLLVALREAAPGDVLVVVNPVGRRAVCGELFATEAQRRGLAGIVVDGFCRDVRGLRRVGLPVYARGTTPASGSTRDPGTLNTTVSCGGVTISPGDLVVGDEDGLAVATPEQAAAAIDTAEEIERTERALVAGMNEGRDLPGMSTVGEHLEALAAGRASSLGFTVRPT